MKGEPRTAETSTKAPNSTEFPRILLISNNSLSLTGSNGRTLANLLEAYPSSCIQQFFITDQVPTSSRADRYFRITDLDAVRYLVRRESPGKYVMPAGETSAAAPPKSRRTPLRMLMRELVWLSVLLRTPLRFNQFVANFSPDIIFVQAGDAAFMLRLAKRTARRRSIPYMIYNSEDYYFRTHNYLTGSRLQWPLYKAWHAYYRFHLRRVFTDAGHIFSSCSPLHERFAEVIPTPGSVLLTPTLVKKRTHAPPESMHKIVYAGNLGLGRLEALLQFASILEELGRPDCTIEVFGPEPAPRALGRLNSARNINYRGFVPYPEVVDQIRSADLLVHVENSDPKYRRDLRYAFSTKIPDALASGTGLLLFAPREVAITQYLEEHGAAIVATNESELRESLKDAFENPRRRRDTAERALRLVDTNHTAEVNSMRVADMARSLVRRGPKAHK